MAWNKTENPAILHIIAKIARVEKKIARLESIKNSFSVAIDAINMAEENLKKEK